MHRYVIAALLGVLLISSPPAARAADTPPAAAPTAAPTAADPWEQVNRKAYAFEDALDRHVIRHVARLYRWLTPGPIGRGLHNLFVNLSEPGAFVNDVLQLRFRPAGVAAARFVTNSTIGLLGLIDVAGRHGLSHQGNEFGVTMGRFGLRPGPYMYVPLVGPTTVRDLVGAGADLLIDPVRWASYNRRNTVKEARLVGGGLDLRVSTEDQLNALLSGALDPYATLRSTFLQNKQGEVDGSGVPADLPSFDEPDTAPVPPPTSAPLATPAPPPDPAGAPPPDPAGTPPR